MSELCSVPRVSERFAQSNALDEDIARLKYVSGKREEALRRLGIRTVGDLLLHIPHRYLDFTRSWSIEMAPIGTVCTIIATVDRIVQKQTVSPEQLQEQAGVIIRENAAHRRSMKQALAASSTGIISEFKRRSPSKGWINEAAQAEEIPASYEAAGAAALSILTDEKFFGGTLRDIRTARPLVHIPILRKDFIIDEY